MSRLRTCNLISFAMWAYAHSCRQGLETDAHVAADVKQVDTCRYMTAAYSMLADSEALRVPSHYLCVPEIFEDQGLWDMARLVIVTRDR